MALKRTWYSRVNVDFPAQTSDTNVKKAVMWLLKAFLKGAPHAPGVVGAQGAPPASSFWTVAGSSDGTTSGMDGADRWGDVFDPAKMVSVWNTGPHSWIVMRSPTINGRTHYLLLDYVQNGSSVPLNNCIMYIATSPFAGGSASVRPVAPGELQIATGGYAFVEDVANMFLSTWRVHFSATPDGYFFFCVTRGGQGAAAVRFAIALWPVTPPTAGDVGDFAWFLTPPAPGGLNVVSFIVANHGARYWGVSRDGSTRINMGAVVPMGPSPSALVTHVQGPNPLSGKWDEFPAQLVGVTPSQEIVRGIVDDVGGISTTCPIFTNTPVGLFERVNIGGLLVPMNAGIVP